MTTAAQRRENRAARQQRQRNQRDLTRLDRAERDINRLPPAPAGSPEAARRQQLLDAIRDKRDDLTRMNDLIDDFLASDDDDEREHLQDDIDNLRDSYRDTSALGGGRVDDPCVPCRIEEHAWDIVRVRPTTWQRQYVNFDSRHRPRGLRPPERHDRRITVTAEISPRRRGRLVYWTLHADPGNRTLHFSQGGNPAAVPPVPHPPLPASHAASLSRVSSRTNARGIATVRLTMGLYGGDKFQVSAAREAPIGPPGPAAAGAALRTAVFEVWRKLWYAVNEMNRPAPPGGQFQLPADSTTAAVNSYQNVFVELLNSGEKKSGPYRENFETHPASERWADRLTTRKFTPWKVVYSVINYLVPLANRQARVHTEPSVTANNAPLTGQFALYDFRVGTRRQRRNWFISAQATDLNTGTTVQIPRANFTRTVPPPRGPTQLRVNLAGIGLPAGSPGPGSRVQVVLNYYHAPGFNGWGGPTRLHEFICRGSMDIGYGANVAAAMGGTCTHEPGHALGLVYAPLAWRDATPGQLDHCTVQACVMWWANYTVPALRPTTFHVVDDTGTAVDPNCHTFVRGKDMSWSVMHPVWKFPR